MLGIETVNHVGIRVAEKSKPVNFSESLGFTLVIDVGFESVHGVVMRYPSGVVANLLGPDTTGADSNAHMDIEEKHPGYTHPALTVFSLESARNFLTAQGIAITGSLSYGDMSTIFIRGPDLDGIEPDAYGPQARMTHRAMRNILDRCMGVTR